MVFELTTPQQHVFEQRPLYLRTDDAVIGTTRPFEDATYPQFLLDRPVRPAAYIEAAYQPVDDATAAVQIYECVDATGERLSEAAIFAVPTRVRFPVPEESNIVRVAGPVGPDGFLVGGACWYAALVGLVEREVGSIDKSARILDWGVGCGRIARHFVEDGFEEVHGVDIDAFNVAWCAANLPGATFQRCDFDPPLPYASSSFDVVYGHSVFSHLDEPSEAIWWKELNRVLAPGGIGCVTFSSEFTARLDFSHLLEQDPTILPALMEQGRYDLGPQSVGVDEGRAGYYRLTLHTRERVQREWTRYVDVTRIIPGFADSQDAVVFRKKSHEGAPPIRPCAKDVTTGDPSVGVLSSQWRWEGDDPAQVYVVGHSHRAALVAAIRMNPDLNPVVPVAVLHGADEARQEPDDAYWDMACRLPHSKTLAIVWNGNQHNASFLFMPSPPFTIASVLDAPGTIVPEEAIRAFFMPTVVELGQLLERIGDSLQVIVAGTPPPTGDAIVREGLRHEPMLKQLIVERGFDDETAPLTPGRLRIALWQIVQDLLREVAAAHGATFVPVPADAIGANGHLRDELSWRDATHANERYGALMVRAIADEVVKARTE